MLRVGELGPDDVAEVTRFLQVAYAQSYAGRHAITAEMFTNEPFRLRTETALRERFARGDGLMLCLRDDTERIVATIGLRPDENDTEMAEIWGFYVVAEQRRGHGKVLWAALMAGAPTLTYDQLYLYAVLGSDHAVAFYQDRGFVIEDGIRTWDWPTSDRPVRTPYLTMRRPQLG